MQSLRDIATTSLVLFADLGKPGIGWAKLDPSP